RTCTSKLSNNARHTKKAPNASSGSGNAKGNLLFRRRLGPLGQDIQERKRVLGSRDGAGQRGLEGHHAPVELAGGVLVLVNGGPAQLQSSEQSTSPGVAEHLRLQFPVGIGGRLAARL